MGQGLQRVLKAVGSMITEGEDGSKVVWYWDYANDKAVRKDEMTENQKRISDAAKLVISRYPDAHAFKWAKLSIYIKSSLLGRISGIFHTEEEAWLSAKEWIEKREKK